MGVSIFGALQDTYFMGRALDQAQIAYKCQEIPIGSIVVDAMGTVIGHGYNRVEQLYSQRAHAEMIALEEAGRARSNWRLDGCWLYVTLEPCAMCMGLAQLSRLAGVVYGAPSPLWGYRLDNDECFRLYKRDTLNNTLNNTLIVISGVEGQRAEQLLKTFFKEKRTKASG